VKIKLFLNVFVLILFQFIVIGTAKSQIIEITGQILNSTTKKPIPYANILNPQQGKTSVSDSAGFFHFTLLKTETLRISSIGYETRYVDFDGFNEDKQKIVILTLQEKNYELATVDIFKARWTDFKFEFSHIEPKVNKTQVNIQAWVLSLVDAQQLAAIVAAKSVGFAIPYVSKRERQLEKVKELEKQDAFDQIIAEKYNSDLVKKITGLDEEKVLKFMDFCSFDKASLLLSNDYDIVMKIKRMYELYKSSQGTNFN